MSSAERNRSTWFRQRYVYDTKQPVSRANLVERPRAAVWAASTCVHGRVEALPSLGMLQQDRTSHQLGRAYMAGVTAHKVICQLWCKTFAPQQDARPAA